MHVTLDFETRSRVDIKERGGWVYSEDQSTEPMCLAYTLGEDDEPRLWHPEYPAAGLEATGRPIDLFEAIKAGAELEAHNAFFERSIWKNVMVRRWGWPAVDERQWRCSAAKASSFALPRALDEACEALGLPFTKDPLGKRVMLKLSRPRKPTKSDPDSAWHEGLEDLQRLFSYCKQDVRAERSLSRALRDLPEHELAIWQMDQRMNERGVYCDREGVEAALSIISEITERLTEELRELTGGVLEKPTQRARIKEWMNEHGVDMEDTQGSTIDRYLGYDTVVGTPRRVLTILRQIGRTSTAKYLAMRERMSDVDDRIRDTMMYHGASTGRWAGKGIQPHNFPRGGIKDMEGAWEDIKRRDPRLLELLWDDPMELLSHATRGALLAPPGRDLVVADYAAIEARVLFWLAGEEEALRILRSGEDIYCDLAKEIYRRPINKKDHPRERQLGKIGILGLGYQMGAPKFVDTAAANGVVIDETFAKTVVDAYRAKYPKVPELWRDYNDAAMEAVRAGGRVIHSGRVQWAMRGRFLHCRLPSGRLLSYYNPRIRDKKTPWGEMRPALTYMGVDPYTKQWARIDTYGGKLVENVDQATARDLMAEAMLRADQGGLYDVTMSVHDELVAEVDEGRGDVKDFERLMSHLPPWAHGCPVAAEGWRGKRYRK